MSYFLYKANWIPGLGGACPRPQLVPSTTLGLAHQNPWYLGSTTDATDLEKIKEFGIIPISDSEAAGFPLIGLTEMIDDAEAMPPTTRALTGQETTDQAVAVKLLSKLNVRNTIGTLVGDQAEIIAVMAKQIALLEVTLAQILADGTWAIDQDLQDGFAQLLADKAATTHKDTVDVCGKTRETVFADNSAKTNAIATELAANYY